MGENPANDRRLRLTARRVGLMAAIVLGALAVALGPPWLKVLWGRLPRPSQRRLALAYLDGLLIGYVLSLLGSLVGIAVVLVLRVGSRGAAPARRRRQARLLTLGVSVLLGVMVLDAGAAAWSAWRHRIPRLPQLGGAAARAGPDSAGRAPMPGSPLAAPPSRPAPRANSTATGPLRILVVGESSARGEPYHPWLSVGQIVAWKLERVFPGRPIQLEIRAIGGASLDATCEQLAGLTYRPDALIAYVGHNEFQIRFGWMREVDYYRDDFPEPYSPRALTSALRFSPLCRLVLETWDRQHVDVRPPRMVTRELVDRPVCTAEEDGRILENFRRRLETIAAYCERIGALPIFIIPASNDAGYDPSRSVLAAETPKLERIAFARAVARARALERTDPAAALRLDRELVACHPEFAETQYRLAKLLEQIGAWDEARGHYIRAREGDAMPLRCPERFRRLYRELAARHPDLLLIDGPRVLEAASRHGILDDSLFHDAQHPNLRGYAALAQDLLHQLGRRRAFGWPEGAEVPRVDVDACARHFGLDASRWVQVCHREAAFYQATAYIRYDPKFRNERAVAYRRAAEAIAAGQDPARAGIPGWGMRPRPVTSSHLIPAAPAGPPPW